MSDSLQPHESQHARPPCPSPTPAVHSNSCPLSQWCHTAISSSVVQFSSCPQSLPASESFPMSELFRQIWPWNMEWSRGKANRVLPRICTGHSKHPLPTTQEKTLHMDITRWSTLKSNWLYSLQPKMEKLYKVNKNKTRSWLWLRSWTPYYQIQTQIEKSRENR